jgi:hypothetical protein
MGTAIMMSKSSCGIKLLLLFLYGRAAISYLATRPNATDRSDGAIDELSLPPHEAA